jgi:hypothetical protein
MTDGLSTATPGAGAPGLPDPTAPDPTQLPDLAPDLLAETERDVDPEAVVDGDPGALRLDVREADEGDLAEQLAEVPYDDDADR